MNAIIEVTNLAKRMVGARIGAGELVVFELRDASKPSVGDTINFRDFSAMGKRRYQNTTQKLEMRVYVRNIVGSLPKARELCFLKP